MRALRDKLQKLFDAPRGLAKRIGWRGNFNHQIFRARHQQAHVIQLPLRIEAAGADTANLNPAVHQIIRIGHGQPGQCRQKTAARRNFQVIIIFALIKVRRPDNATDFNELAVFLSAGNFFKRNFFGGRKNSVAERGDFFQHHDRRKFSGAGLAFDLNFLTRLQRRRIHHPVIDKINTSRIVLKKTGKKVAVKKTQCALQTHRQVARCLFQGQLPNLPGRS